MNRINFEVSNLLTQQSASHQILEPESEKSQRDAQKNSKVHLDSTPIIKANQKVYTSGRL